MRKIYLLCLAVPMAACASTSASGAPPRDLETAREVWATAGLDSYRFLFENDCGECLPEMAEPREVTVRGGAAESPDDATVEMLFQTIAEAIAAGTAVEVSYDAEFGYPTEIWIDKEARAYDGGTHWLISEVEPLS